MPRGAVLLLIDVPLPADFHLAPFGKKVDDRHADAVQTARGLIRPLRELATEFQHRHHALQRGETQVLMILDRDTATVVLDRHRAVGVDRHADVLGVAGHGLVDRVVDHFVHQVVQTAQAGIADVHARPLAHVLEVAQMFELLGAVFGFDLAIFRHVRRRVFWARRSVGEFV